MVASTSPGVYCRLRNLRPNLDVVRLFAFDAVAVQRAQNISCWKGTCDGVTSPGPIVPHSNK